MSTSFFPWERTIKHSANYKIAKDEELLRYLSRTEGIRVEFRNYLNYSGSTDDFVYNCGLKPTTKCWKYQRRSRQYEKHSNYLTTHKNQHRLMMLKSGLIYSPEWTDPEYIID